MVPVGYHPASHPGPPGGQIDPCHRVAITRFGLGHGGHCGLQVAGPKRVDQDFVPWYRGHPYVSIENDPGQAHPPNGRAEQLGIGGRVHLDQVSIGEDDPKRGDMGSKRANGMMILSMDVCGDGASDGDVACARGHRDKKAFPVYEADQLAYRCPRGTANQPGVTIQPAWL